MHYKTWVELGPIGEIPVELEIAIDGYFKPARMMCHPDDAAPEESDVWPLPDESRITGGHPLLNTLTEDEAACIVEYICDKQHEKIVELGMDLIRNPQRDEE